MKKEDLKFVTDNELWSEIENDPEYIALEGQREIDRSIIRAIIDAREAKKLTQREFSKRIGITQSALARMESGKALNPTIGFLNKILKGVGLKIAIVPVASK